MFTTNYKFGWFGTVFQILTHYCAKLYYVLKYDIRIKNLKAVPKDKSNYIIVANHIAYDDIALICYLFKYRITFLAKEELFKNFFSGIFFRGNNVIPVNRGSPKPSLLKLSKKALNSPGWRLCVFLEGTRSDIEGQLGRPQAGPMVIAKVAKKPILPVGISYRKKKGKKTRAIINIGEFYEIDESKDTKDQAWDALERISKLCDQELPPRPTKDLT